MIGPKTYGERRDPRASSKKKRRKKKVAVKKIEAGVSGAVLRDPTVKDPLTLTKKNWKKATADERKRVYAKRERIRKNKILYYLYNKHVREASLTVAPDVRIPTNKTTSQSALFVAGDAVTYNGTSGVVIQTSGRRARVRGVGIVPSIWISFDELEEA